MVLGLCMHLEVVHGVVCMLQGVWQYVKALFVVLLGLCVCVYTTWGRYGVGFVFITRPGIICISSGYCRV